MATFCIVDGDIERRLGEARCHGRDSCATAVEGAEDDRQALPLGSDEAIGLEKGTVTVGTGRRAGVQLHIPLRPAELDAVHGPEARKHDMPRHPGLVWAEREQKSARPQLVIQAIAPVTR